MVKKIFKGVLGVLMILGLVLAISNTIEVELDGETGKWVYYDEELPDCYGDSGTCYDTTKSKDRN